MKNFIEKSILLRNGDLLIGLILAVAAIIFLRSENHGLNGIFYQWLSYVLVMSTAVSLGSYTQRKIFPYFRPDDYLPQDWKTSKGIDPNKEQFRMAIMCGWFRLVYIMMWVLSGVILLKNII